MADKFQRPPLLKGESETEPLLPASRLERVLGKPSSEWSVDDLIDLVRDRRIRLVSLMHVGGDGRLKTLDFVPRDKGHLRDVLVAGERADGSSLFGSLGVPTAASDIVLRPRIQTAFIDPFAWESTLCLVCGHNGRDGEPLAESPDTMLHRAYERTLAETGVELHALGELEFFLGKTRLEGDISGANDCGYHAASPFVFGEGLRRQAMALLAEIGTPVKYGHSEVGYVPSDRPEDLIWEQHEIELSLQPLPRAAEAVVLTAWVLRNLAHRARMRCSFDPIVKPGHAGSGLHFHMSPVVDGEHRGGVDDAGELSKEGRWLVGGLARLGGALMAFGNTEPSSFVRLTQGKEAPSTVTWGRFNRKVLIRLPVVARDPEGRVVTPPTIEFRLPDGSAQPHLLLAGIAQGLVLGSRDEKLDSLLEETRAGMGQGAQRAEPVPRDFDEVALLLDRHRGDLEAGGVFPSNVVDRFERVLHAKAEATPVL